MPSLRLRAFAKVNLCLKVLGKRPDNYHELRTVFQAISLHDTLEMRPDGPVLKLECEGAALPAGPGNLVWRAVEAMQRALGFRAGLDIRLTKRIPVGRGLGGGSSDAAAAMMGVMRLAGRTLPPERLIEIASGLGADVPFFLFGGRALGVGRGDEIYPLPDGPRRTLLVVSPREIAVSTPQAYGWLRRRLTKVRHAPKLWSFCALCWSPQEARLSNDFETAVFRRHPGLRKIRQGLLRRGAAEAALAGSGSAVFGIFRNPAQARRAASGFPNDQVFLCETLSREEYGRARFLRSREERQALGRR